jgi:hypothetical protein
MGRHLDRGQEVTVAWVRLSKIDHYLPDNASCSRLSYLRWAVDDETRCGLAFENSPGRVPPTQVSVQRSGREPGAPGRVAHSSLKKVRQQSCDVVHEHGATVDSHSALYYFPCCFNDCSVGFRLC